MNNAGRYVIFIASAFRSVAIGFMSVYLGISLAHRGLSSADIGFIIGSGLLGTTLSAILVMYYGNRGYQKELLLLLTFLMFLGVLLGFSERFVPTLMAISFFTMMNGMGRDRGGLRALDQSLLPDNISSHERTFAFAWYNLIQDGGLALGAFLVGLPEFSGKIFHRQIQALDRWSFSLYGVLLLLSAIAYLFKPKQVSQTKNVVSGSSPSNRRIWNLTFLFAIDSIGGGFLTTTLIAYWFFERFHVSPSTIGFMFAGARVLNMVSMYSSALLARRFGLVRTMVFSHLPSSLFLITASIAPNFPIALFFFLLREGLVEMDVPARESYVMAVVHPEERARASGMTSVAKNLGWAVSPFLAGIGMSTISLGFGLIVGASFKILYDILLYTQFRKIKPPEESAF